MDLTEATAWCPTLLDMSHLSLVVEGAVTEQVCVISLRAGDTTATDSMKINMSGVGG